MEIGDTIVVVIERDLSQLLELDSLEGLPGPEQH